MKFKKDLPESSGNGANFVKLKDRESITGIFMGEPYEFHSVWENGKTKVVDANHPGASFRFRINFVVKDGPIYLPKIFENGVSVYRDLSDLNDEYKLEDTVVKITRNGVDKNTTYSILPLLKADISPETKKYLKTIKLLDLGHKESDRGFSGAPMPSDEDVPF